MKITLNVWRQSGPAAPGKLVTYQVDDCSPDMSFLELLDVLNEQLIAKGEEPVAFDHDCREGICGMCSLMINGQAHGPQKGTATCQLHMRKFPDGPEITIEPWRATAFPIIKDLMVDRAAFDRIVEAGGYITVQAGSAPDANLMPIPKVVADASMDRWSRRWQARPCGSSSSGRGRRSIWPRSSSSGASWATRSARRMR